MFEVRRLPTVLTAQEIIDKAFRRASKVGGRNTRERIINKLSTVSNILSDYFDKIIKNHPNYSELSDFYREMIDILVGIDKLKKSLGAVNWAKNITRAIITRGIREVKAGKKDPVEVLRATYGRVSSVIEQISEELEFLKNAKSKLKEIPVFTEDPTLVVAGYPNVGKSSFVARVSSVKPEIATYPFTTKSIHIGYLNKNGLKIQVIDTPGLLDRPIHKRNIIEKKAILCLKHLADCILFIIDPTGTCGYPVEPQFSLLNEIKREFKDTPIIAAYSKSDLHNLRDLPAFSSVTGEGVENILNEVFKNLKDKKSKSFSVKLH